MMSKVLLINGSTRKNGFNAQLTEQIKVLFQDLNQEVRELFWHDLPIFCLIRS